MALRAIYGELVDLPAEARGMMYRSANYHVDLQPLAYAERAGTVYRISLYVCETCATFSPVERRDEHQGHNVSALRGDDFEELARVAFGYFDRLGAASDVGRLLYRN